jgi:hypothetical protein
MGKTKSYQQLVAEQKLPGIVQILESCMNFEKWGFKQSFYGVAQGFAPSVIYDSKSCRVRFEWQLGEPRDGYDILRIRYGRLHAPDHQRFILCHGVLSHCWHDSYLALHFLDGLSPDKAVERRNKWPYIIDQFIQTNKGKTWSNIEWTVRAHASVWEHYGDRLFSLFDLRYPDKWQTYTYFIKEFHRLNPVRVNDPSEPSPELIC